MIYKLFASLILIKMDHVERGWIYYCISLGNVETCRSFSAINLNTRDIVTCFGNNANAPRLFQQIAEPVVGSLDVIPEWLSRREGLEMAKEKVFSHQIQYSNLNETASVSHMHAYFFKKSIEYGA